MMALNPYAAALNLGRDLHLLEKQEIRRGSWRAVKRGRLAIVLPNNETVKRNVRNLGLQMVTAIAYPHPEHEQEFMKAARGLKEEGPSKLTKGAVGVLFANVLPKNSGSLDMKDMELSFHYAQANYKTEGEHALPRSLATKYGGWRVHALAEVIRLAHENGIHLVLDSRFGVSPDFNEKKKPFDEKSAFYNDLKRATELANGKIVRTKTRIKIIPREKT